MVVGAVVDTAVGTVADAESGSADRELIRAEETSFLPCRGNNSHKLPGTAEEAKTPCKSAQLFDTESLVGPVGGPQVQL